MSLPQSKRRRLAEEHDKSPQMLSLCIKLHSSELLHIKEDLQTISNNLGVTFSIHPLPNEDNVFSVKMCSTEHVITAAARELFNAKVKTFPGSGLQVLLPKTVGDESSLRENLNALNVNMKILNRNFSESGTATDTISLCGTDNSISKSIQVIVTTIKQVSMKNSPILNTIKKSIPLGLTLFPAGLAPQQAQSQQQQPPQTQLHHNSSSSSLGGTNGGSQNGGGGAPPQPMPPVVTPMVAGPQQAQAGTPPRLPHGLATQVLANSSLTGLHTGSGGQLLFLDSSSHKIGAANGGTHTSHVSHVSQPPFQILAPAAATTKPHPQPHQSSGGIAMSMNHGELLRAENHRLKSLIESLQNDNHKIDENLQLRRMVDSLQHDNKNLKKEISRLLTELKTSKLKNSESGKNELCCDEDPEHSPRLGSDLSSSSLRGNDSLMEQLVRDNNRNIRQNTVLKTQMETAHADLQSLNGYRQLLNKVYKYIQKEKSRMDAQLTYSRYQLLPDLSHTILPRLVPGSPSNVGVHSSSTGLGGGSQSGASSARQGPPPTLGGDVVMSTPPQASATGEASSPTTSTASSSSATTPSSPVVSSAVLKSSPQSPAPSSPMAMGITRGNNCTPPTVTATIVPNSALKALATAAVAAAASVNNSPSMTPSHRNSPLIVATPTAE